VKRARVREEGNDLPDNIGVKALRNPVEVAPVQGLIATEDLVDVLL
jgi:hypothetical protein